MTKVREGSYLSTMSNYNRNKPDASKGLGVAILKPKGVE
jgi:hypothetical protein